MGRERVRGMDREEEGVEWDGCRERYVKRGEAGEEEGRKEGDGWRGGGK